ncbi:DUF2892 domain-containing protein, partial [Dysosmobacter welbionis]
EREGGRLWRITILLMNRDLKPSTGSCIRTCSAVRRSPCGLAEAGTSPSPGVRKRWCRSCSPSLGSIRQIFGAAPRPRD